MKARRSTTRFLRALLGTGVLGGFSLAYALYGAGIWDPFPIATAPVGFYAPGSAASDDAQGFGIGRAHEGFAIVELLRPQSAHVSTQVSWRATGSSFEPRPAPERGYIVTEPRLEVMGRAPGEVTELRSPRGTLTSPTAPGPLRALLEGGVRLDEARGFLETEQLTVLLPPAPRETKSGDPGPIAKLALDRRAQHAQIDTTSPVHAILRSEGAALGTSTVTIDARGGASGDADLRRVLLKGPVRARDDSGRIALDARDHVLMTLRRSPRDLLGWIDGPAASIGGASPLVPSIGQKKSYDLERVIATGSVELTLVRPASADQPPLDLVIAGDFVEADLARGFVLVAGHPGRVEERSLSRKIEGRVIILEDRGMGEVDFLALGDAEVATALKATRRRSVRRVWVMGGDRASGKLANTADPGDPPELEVLEAEVAGSPLGTRAWLESDDGRLSGELDLITVTKDLVRDDEKDLLVPGKKDTIRGYGFRAPIKATSAESTLRARELELVREKGKPDLLELRGGVDAHLGRDLAAMGVETTNDEAASTSGLAAGGPWDLSGEVVNLDIWPKPVDRTRELAWWEKSSLVRAHVARDARLFGFASSGDAFSVSGEVVDADLASGKVAAMGEPACAALGSSSITARELAGNLESGALEASGRVHARRDLPASPKEAGSGAQPLTERGAAPAARFVTLDAAHVTATIDPDEEHQKARRLERARARKLGKRETGPPAELLAARAEGDAHERAILAGSDGSSLESDTLEYDHALGRARALVSPGNPRVHYLSPLREVEAREAELDIAPRPDGSTAYRLELTGEVEARGASPADRNAEAARVAIAADRARADAWLEPLASSSELAWGPVIAWSTSDRPVVISRAQETNTLPEYEARGRVLRSLPDSRSFELEGIPGDPAWCAFTPELVKALRADPSALESASFALGARSSDFALRAPLVKFALKPEARRPPPLPRTKKTEKASRFDREEAHRERDQETDKLATYVLTRSLASLHATGPLTARLGGQRVHASDLDYDGKRRLALITGDPVEIEDAHGHTQEARRWIYRVDDAPVNQR